MSAVCRTCGRSLNSEERLDRAQVRAEYGLGREDTERAFRSLAVTTPPGSRKVYIRRRDLERWLDDATYEPRTVRPTGWVA